VKLDEERTTEWRDKIIMLLITGREKCMTKGGENEGRGYKVEFEESSGVGMTEGGREEIETKEQA